MKLKRGIALLLAAVFLFGTLAVPASAAAAQPELAAQAQTVDAEENDIISVRIKASGELTYGADHKLEIQTTPADAQYIGVVMGTSGQATGYVTLVLSEKIRTLLKQGADLFRQHQRHIAGSLPAGAHDHADVLGIGRGSLDLQLVVRTVGQLTGCLDAHRDDIIFFCIHGLCLRCQFRLCCGGTGRNGQRAEQEHGCQQKGNASFQFHRVLNLLFCSRAPGTLPVGKRPLRPVLYPDFTAKPAVGQ